MPKASPWHSIKSPVHHNNTECNTGNNIERENLRQGTGGKPLCDECDRLKKAGSSGRRAVFTIENAAVTESLLQRKSGIRGALTVDQSERYDAMLAIRLEIFDIAGRSVGVVEANAERSRSVPEDITLDAREKIWFSITESLANDLNAELDRAIPQFLGQYLR